VDFEAPSSCPTREIFYDDLRARTSHFSMVQGEGASRRFEISVRDEGQEFVGTITVAAGSGASERRELRARSCEEVLETFALIVAVAIDPNAKLSTPRPPMRPPPPSEPHPAPASVAVAAVSPPTRQPVRREASASPPPERGAERLAWTGLLGVGVAARGGIAPNAATTGELSGELDHELAPAFGIAGRLELIRSASISAADAVGRRIDFTLTSGRFEACAFGAHLGRALVIETGVGLELGALSITSASSVTGARSQTRPWVAPAFAGVLRWAFVGPWAAELHAGALIPLVRDQYRFVDPPTAIAGTSSLTGFAGIALNFRLN
jgi:hypothetical protein